MTVYDVLFAMDRNEVWSKEGAKNHFGDCRSDTTLKVTLCFMSEEETWVTMELSSPLLVPFYDTEIESLDPRDNEMLIWIADEDWFPTWGKIEKE